MVDSKCYLTINKIEIIPDLLTPTNLLRTLYIDQLLQLRPLYPGLIIVLVDRIKCLD